MSASLFAIVQQYFAANPRIRCEHTQTQYLHAIRNLRASLGGREPTLTDLTDDNVLAMMRWLEVHGLAVRTINERRCRLNALWSWCAKRGMVATWPTVGPWTVPRRTPLAWSLDQLRQLLAACDHERGQIGGMPARLWWRSLHLVSWDTGERITALLSSRWDHLDSEWLTIPAESRKGKRQDMAYRLSGDSLAALEMIRCPCRDLIWPWSYCPSYLWLRYRFLRARAGLPTDRRSSFHRMRRSVASHYAAAGGDASALLGHSSPRVTAAYLDPRITGRLQAVDLLPRLVRVDGPDLRTP